MFISHLFRRHAARPAHGLAFDVEGGAGAEPTFTQAQVDDAVTQAIKRERAVVKAVLSGTSMHQPIDAAAVLKLASENLGFDRDGRMVVLGDRRHLSVSDYLTEFAKANSYLFEGGQASRGGKPTGQVARDTQGMTGIQKIAAGFAQQRT